MIYNCTALTTFKPKKVHLGLEKSEFKKQKYNLTKSFRNENYANSTALSSYVSKMKKTEKETPTTIPKHKAMFSPRKVSYTHVSKSE